MSDSIIAAYTGQEALPSAGVAGALPGASPQTAGQTAIEPATNSLTEELLHQLALEAEEPAPAEVPGPTLIAGIPFGSSPSVRRPRILLGVSGSVATIKLSLVARTLLQFADVHIVASKSSRHFFSQRDLPDECGPVLTDEDEWRQWRQVGDPVVHIELRRWADVFIIAPLSANTLAKVANGLCDNLLTCVVRAWDFKKPLLVAPAMNTYMWESPFTEQHLDACRKLGIVVIPPVAKKLACGDVGNGGMAAPDAIAQAARDVCERAGFPIEAGLQEESDFAAEYS